jgi:two-component system LytT family response regulator
MNNAQNDNTITCVILEDEPIAMELMIDIVKTFPVLHTIGKAASIDKALELIVALKPQLVISDIKLTGGPVFNLIKRLRQIETPMPSFIVNTGYDDKEFLLESQNNYSKEVVKFIPKPVQAHVDGWLKDAIIEVEEYVRSQAATAPKSILINMTGELVKVELDDVLYIKIEGKYLIVFTQNKPYRLLETLVQFQTKNQLPENFLTIIKGCVVNMNYCARLKVAKEVVVLNNNVELKYSRSYYPNIKQYLGK